MPSFAPAWRRYLLSCGLLLLPILLFDAALFDRLPPAISDASSWDAIPPALALAERVLRVPVFLLPFLMSLRMSTARQRAGAVLTVLGMLVYFASWMGLIAAPESGWSLSAAGFLAPAYTPALWLLGIALLGEEFCWGRPCPPWLYGSLSTAFLLVHVAHAAIVYAHNAPAAS